MSRLSITKNVQMRRTLRIAGFAEDEIAEFINQNYRTHLSQMADSAPIDLKTAALVFGVRDVNDINLADFRVRLAFFAVWASAKYDFARAMIAESEAARVEAGVKSAAAKAMVAEGGATIAESEANRA
ncbi:hypothetical protein ACO0LM_12020 [Undibacterium sp. Di26W]|uniref:hypothetical protein n=1 Tax=Undibacterium sp. Di26W TaxID=3413035 RepID=UPI003BEFE9F7